MHMSPRMSTGWLENHQKHVRLNKVATLGAYNYKREGGTTNLRPDSCNVEEKVRIPFFSTITKSEKLQSCIFNDSRPRKTGFEQIAGGHVSGTTNEAIFCVCSFFTQWIITIEFHQNLKGSCRHQWLIWHGLTLLYFLRNVQILLTILFFLDN